MCLVCGTPQTQLLGSALTWLTLGAGRGASVAQLATAAPAPHTTAHQTSFRRLGVDVQPVPNGFWLVLGKPRYFSNGGAPVFTFSGSNMRNRLGWAVLPGPSNNPALHAYLLAVALVGYRGALPPRL